MPHFCMIWLLVMVDVGLEQSFLGVGYARVTAKRGGILLRIAGSGDLKQFAGRPFFGRSCSGTFRFKLWWW